jgi:hypothetical protein
VPRLLRIRLVSVGHPLARANDLILDFRDATGKATDSTLWLRNGGGKSSILNLFFALLRPHKSEFLGGKAEGKQRDLEDYILRGDRGVVTAEWQLDATAGELDFDIQRMLTGVFYERRDGAGELRRMFFASRVSEAQRESTLEGLPLHARDDGERGWRRTLSSFREVWRTLRDRAPELSVADTENQREWQEILEAGGIDPHLFSYQVRMNLREGGADEMFRFAEPEDFVDFLLELALDPSLGDKVGRNISTYRRELVLRRDQLIPERVLVTGLFERLDPLQAIGGDRSTLRAGLGDYAAEIDALERWAMGQGEALALVAVRAEEEHKEYVRAAEEHARAASELRLRAATLRERAAALRLERLQEEHGIIQREWRNVERASRVWAAAVPLHSENLFLGRAKDCRRQLEERQIQHTPLRARLGEAAGKLAAALSFRSVELRRKASGHQGAEEAARREAREARESAAAADKLEGGATERAHQIQRRLDEVNAVRQRLVGRGALQEGELGADGVARLEAEHTVQGLALERLTLELSRADGALDVLGASLQSVQQLLAEQETAARSLEERWSEASSERRDLEEDLVLRIALELEDLDADRLGDEALATLEARAQKEQELAIEERLAHASDERGSLHIEERGLLPPSPDVQRVLDVLRMRLGAAWSGWEWVSANAPKNEVRDTVRRAPHVAQGVVVRPTDLAAALAIVREQNVDPEAPVVLATPGAFQDGVPLAGEVLGPSESAWFDREAAQTRLRTMRTRLDLHRQRINEAEQRQRELNDRRARLRAFRSRYPRGWFAETVERRERARATVEDTRGRVAETERERAALAARRKDITAEQERVRGCLAEATRTFDHVRSFVEEHERPSVAWRSELERAMHEKDEASRDARTWREMADATEGRADQEANRAKILGEEAREIEKELRDMAFVDAPAQPAPGPLDLLRNHYSQLRLEYETKVGADALRLLAEKNEDDARSARRSLLKLLGEGFTEADVQQALASLAEPDRVEEVRLEKERLAGSLQGRVGNLAARIENAKEKLGSAEEARARLGLPVRVDKIPGEPDLVDVEAGRAEGDAVRQEGLATGAQTAAKNAETAVNNAERRKEAIGRVRGKLTDLRENFGDMLTHAEATATPGVVLEDDVTLGRRAGEVERELREARRRWQTLDARRQSAAQEVRTWIGRPEHRLIEASWVRSLSERDDVGLENSAARLGEQLRLRGEQLDAQIAEAERHRVVLVDEVLAVAEEGLKLLRRASNVSRLPDHIPGLGGTHFLRIIADAPEDPEERRGRVGELVDQFATTDRPMGGVALVQAAVRRLGRPIQVRVLHPDPALERRMVSIPEMARFSGGEQLTGAILLYCTLARLRARSRALSGRPSSVLILDNPIGRVSRPRFLEIQREVARAMGVQLIYATGVNDYEALGVLPNIIRLRNERIDRNRGHRLVEHDISGEGGIEAVRVGRNERGVVKPSNTP